MAVRLPQISDLHSRTDTKMVFWEGLVTGDTADPVEMPDWPDMTVQIVGTFAGGTSVSLTGSNDGTNYVALTDPQGNAITKTAAALEAVTEAPRYIKPTIASGVADDIDVYLICRKANR